MSVRIGIDFRAALSHPCGIARYSRELARGLLSLNEDIELVLYSATRYGSVLDRIPRAIREHPRSHLIERRLPAKALKALCYLPGFNLKWITGPIALLHHTDLTYLPNEGTPEIVTVHDLAYEISPRFHEPDFRATVGERVRQAVERATLIIVPSESTRRDLLERHEVEAERIRVIPHGVDHVLRKLEETDHPDQDGVPRSVFEKPYLLHVGTIEPRKNLVRVLQAFEKIRREGIETRLVIAGPKGWMTEAYERALNHCAYRHEVFEVGSVEESTLRKLYRSATAVVYPSLYEGYGLPVVEAMAQGVPVMTSDRSATQEIAGDDAVLCDPEDVDSMARGMAELVKNEALRDHLRKAGRRKTSLLTWQRTARQTYEAYREVLQGRVQPPSVQARTATA